MKRTNLVRTVLAVALTIPVATFAATNTTSTTAKSTTHSSHMVKQTAPKVNVNTATRDQLMALPGIDDATAQKIIAARPFQSVDQLLKQNLVTKEEYSKIHARLIAKPVASESVKK